jgi:hypothetical protein
VAYTLLLVATSAVIVRSAWSVDGATMTDGHAIVSLDLAIARAFCGIPSSFSHHIRIPMDVGRQMELRHVPLRTLVAQKAGSIDAYCRSVDEPFVNSENSLMVLETAALYLEPGLSLAQLGQRLHWLRIACILGFVVLLMGLGSSLALGLATLLCGLMLLRAMPDHVYSNYPFLFPLVLLAVALHGFASKYRWTGKPGGLMWYGASAGFLSAFVVNMRTSYLPIIGLFAALALVDETRLRGRTVPWRRRAIGGLALAACFLAAYMTLQFGLITRHLPADGRFNASHPFGHPLVLALAVPENSFSRAMGIRWADEVGPQLAARVDPGVPFLGPRYNSALLRYYGRLWRTHPREMFAVYALKFSLSGSDMLRVLRASPGAVGWGVSVLLTPLAQLPNGFWILGLYATILLGSLALYYRRDCPAAFGLALLSLAAVLVQVESGVIFPVFVKQYHNFAAFYALFLSLLGVQAMANAAWALAVRVRPDWAVVE